MQNGFLIVDERGWQTMSPAQKELAIYMTLKDIHQRMLCLEKRPFVDKCMAFFGGAIGGFTAALGMKFLGG